MGRGGFGIKLALLSDNGSGIQLSTAGAGAGLSNRTRAGLWCVASHALPLGAVRLSCRPSQP